MYEAQIAAGAVLLDERVPDWRYLIDPEQLNMRDATQCILGQAMTNYWHAINILNMDDKDVVEAHGFTLPREAAMSCDNCRDVRWALLTKEWKLYLQATAPAA